MSNQGDGDVEATEIIDHDEAVEVYVPPAGAELAVTPNATAHDLVARLAVIREAMQTAMEKDVDYGVIPGTGSKPTLLKPGAEKLSALFQLDVQLENEKTWHDDGHLTVVAKATVFHQPTGHRLGAGEGICTTREAKYAYRRAERVCPACGKPAIIKGRAEYGGGWVCFKKKDGCGAKYQDSDERITSQPDGRTPNPDLADTYNTVDKMASKRARIDAVLAVTGASALFTQDVEAAPGDPGPERPPARQTTVPAAPKPDDDARPAVEPRPINDRQKQQIAIIRKEIGLTDDQYRSALEATYGQGVRSSTQLTEAQGRDLIERLREAKRQMEAKP